MKGKGVAFFLTYRNVLLEWFLQYIRTCQYTKITNGVQKFNYMFIVAMTISAYSYEYSGCNLCTYMSMYLYKYSGWTTPKWYLQHYVFKLLDISINERKFTIYEKFIVIIMYLAYLGDLI